MPGTVSGPIRERPEKVADSGFGRVRAGYSRAQRSSLSQRGRMSQMAIGLERDQLRLIGSRPGTAGKGPRMNTAPAGSAARRGAEPSCPATTTPSSAGSTSLGTSTLSAVRGRRPAEVEVLNDLVPEGFLNLARARRPGPRSRGRGPRAFGFRIAKEIPWKLTLPANAQHERVTTGGEGSGNDDARTDTTRAGRAFAGSGTSGGSARGSSRGRPTSDPAGIGTYSQVGAAFRFDLVWTAPWSRSRSPPRCRRRPRGSA